MKTIASKPLMALGVLGWILLIGATFQIQKVKVSLKSGKNYTETHFLPFWKNPKTFSLPEDGSYWIRISYLYGLIPSSSMTGGGRGSVSGHSHCGPLLERNK